MIRKSFLAVAAAAVLSFYLMARFWLEPFLSRYAKFANCHQYGTINGAEVLMYGVFAGLPLSLTLFFSVLLGPGSLRAIRARQDPPPGEKVLRPTRYRRGTKALIRPAALLLTISFMLGVSVWGSFQAYEMTRNIAPCSDQQRLELGLEPDQEA